MRSLRFIPLAFLAGAPGFTLFFSYALSLIAIVHLVRRWVVRA